MKCLIDDKNDGCKHEEERCDCKEGKAAEKDEQVVELCVTASEAVAIYELVNVSGGSNSEDNLASSTVVELAFRLMLARLEARDDSPLSDVVKNSNNDGIQDLILPDSSDYDMADAFKDVDLSVPFSRLCCPSANTTPLVFCSGRDGIHPVEREFKLLANASMRRRLQFNLEVETHAHLLLERLASQRNLFFDPNHMPFYLFSKGNEVERGQLTSPEVVGSMFLFQSLRNGNMGWANQIRNLIYAQGADRALDVLCTFHCFSRNVIKDTQGLFFEISDSDIFLGGVAAKFSSLKSKQGVGIFKATFRGVAVPWNFKCRKLFFCSPSYTIKKVYSGIDLLRQGASAWFSSTSASEFDCCLMFLSHEKMTGCLKSFGTVFAMKFSFVPNFKVFSLVQSEESLDTAAQESAIKMTTVQEVNPRQSRGDEEGLPVHPWNKWSKLPVLNHCITSSLDASELLLNDARGDEHMTPESDPEPCHGHNIQFPQSDGKFKGNPQALMRNRVCFSEDLAVLQQFREFDSNLCHGNNIQAIESEGKSSSGLCSFADEELALPKDKGSKPSPDTGNIFQVKESEIKSNTDHQADTRKRVRFSEELVVFPKDRGSCANISDRNDFKITEFEDESKTGDHFIPRKRVRYSEEFVLFPQARHLNDLPGPKFGGSSASGTCKRLKQSEVKRYLSNSRYVEGKRLIFKGINFLLTGFPNEKEEEIKFKIRKYGGDTLSVIPHPASTKVNRSFGVMGQQLPVIISSGKLETTKFLYGCAVRAFVLKVAWLTDSIKALSLLPPENYMILPNRAHGNDRGIGNSLICYGRQYIFGGVGIMIHGNPKFCSKLELVFKHGGGKVYKTMQLLIQNRDAGRIFAGAIVAEDVSRASRHLKECAKEQKILVVPVGWVISSLYAGDLLPFEENTGKRECSRLQKMKLAEAPVTQ